MSFPSWRLATLVMAVLGFIAIFSWTAPASATPPAFLGDSFTYEPASSIDGSLRLVLTVDPPNAGPEENLTITLTGTSIDGNWDSASLNIDLPAEIERVSGELSWSGPLKASESKTMRAQVKLKKQVLARIRGAGGCSSATSGGSHGWSGSAFFVLNRDLQINPNIELRPLRDPGVQKILAKCRFTRAELLAQQKKGPLRLPFDMPEVVVIPFLKVTYWEEMKRPEVMAAFQSTFQDQSVNGAFQTGDDSFPTQLFEERRADGSYFARGVLINGFGWNPGLCDIEWVEFAAWEYREGPSNTADKYYPLVPVEVPPEEERHSGPSRRLPNSGR